MLPLPLGEAGRGEGPCPGCNRVSGWQKSRDRVSKDLGLMTSKLWLTIFLASASSLLKIISMALKA